ARAGAGLRGSPTRAGADERDRSRGRTAGRAHRALRPDRGRSLPPSPAFPLARARARPRRPARLRDVPRRPAALRAAAARAAPAATGRAARGVPVARGGALRGDLGRRATAPRQTGGPEAALTANLP